MVSGSEEVEVYRFTSFSNDLRYEFAMKTRTEGKYPNEKYYTTNDLQYLGNHISSENWGCGGAENFIDENGKKTKVIYDYEGLTCFRTI